MTEIQILQVLGIVYVAVGLGILFNQNFYRKLFEDFTKSSALIYLSGAITIVLGYAIIIFYNTWADLNAIIVGIMGWAAFIKGLTLIIFPKAYLQIVKYMAKHQKYFTLEALLILTIGGFLMYLGFMS